MKISQKIPQSICKRDQNSGKVAHASPTCSIENEAPRLDGIVGIWADRAEMINPVDFVKKQRASRF